MMSRVAMVRRGARNIALKDIFFVAPLGLAYLLFVTHSLRCGLLLFLPASRAMYILSFGKIKSPPPISLALS